jgi:hypothetical protein
MIAFGKKCPACGSKNLINQAPASRLATLPTVRSCACADCRQQIVLLFAFAIGVERRQLARKQMPPFFLARIPATNQHIRIKDISEGGLCIVQHPNAPRMPNHLLHLDICNCSNGTSLEQIMVEIVATTEQIVESCNLKFIILNNSARFVNLNQAQRKILAACMNQYGT